MKIVTPMDAYQMGVSRFYTGVLCKHGHDSERYLSNHGCVECVRVASDGQGDSELIASNGKSWSEIQESIGLRWA